MTRQKAKKRRALQRSLMLVCLMAVIVTAIRTAANYLQLIMPGYNNIHTTAVSTKRPVIRQGSQISDDLKQYAALHPNAAKIYDNLELYPETLIAAYLNNPEMEDFVINYPKADPSQTGALTSEEAEQNFPLLLQWDSRWGYAPYGESIIGLSGCGPACLSMVLVTLTGDTSRTPDYVAEFSDKNGYYVSGSGTSWSLMTKGATQLGLSVRELPLDEFVMKNALDAGEAIICSMGEGDFTTQGHFILVYGYNQQGFLVNDPNCIARSSRTWTYDQLQGQIKNLWAYQY